MVFRGARFAGATSLICLVVISSGWLVTPLDAQRNRDSQSTRNAEYEYYRAHYLQHEQHDLQAAREGYEKALKMRPGRPLQQLIEENLKSLQEDLAVADFAQLMPADSMLYVEIDSPGKHLEQLAALIGIDGNAPADPNPVVLEIEDGLAISSDFRLSPALTRELSKIRGGAVAVSDLDQRGVPQFVAVFHPGDSDLLAGLLDTGIQLIPNDDQIGGFPTFQIEGEVWLVKTHRLLIASTDREQVSAAIERMAKSGDSLAGQPQFEEARQNHAGAMAFAFVDPAQAFGKLRHMAGSAEEMMIASTVLDIPHMKFAAWSLGCQESGVQSRLQVEFEENHRSLAFNLIKTAPLTGQTLQRVPGDAAIVAALGLNPELPLSAGAELAGQFSAMDIGREFFANIQEASLFVLPSKASGDIPDAGLIIAANDVEKSATLWNELLSIPERIGVDEGPKGKDITIGSLRGRSYRFPEGEIPEIAIVRLDDHTMVIGTLAAVESATQANTGSAADSAANLIADHEHASKLVHVHLGRAMQLANTMDPGGDEMLRAIGSAVGDLSFNSVVNEGPHQFEIVTELVDLPRFGDLVRIAARMHQPARAMEARAYREVDQPSAQDSYQVEEKPADEPKR